MTAGTNSMSTEPRTDRDAEAAILPMSAKAAPQPDSDEQLVSRLRDGDASAGETLVKRYHPALMRYLQRVAGTEHAAEELHQQTWLSVLDHIEKFDATSNPGGLKAW